MKTERYLTEFVSSCVTVLIIAGRKKNFQAGTSREWFISQLAYPVDKYSPSTRFENVIDAVIEN